LERTHSPSFACHPSAWLSPIGALLAGPLYQSPLGRPIGPIFFDGSQWLTKIRGRSFGTPATRTFGNRDYDSQRKHRAPNVLGFDSKQTTLFYAFVRWPIRRWPCSVDLVIFFSNETILVWGEMFSA